MKKILILNGAGKKNGNTAALVKAFGEFIRFESDSHDRGFRDGTAGSHPPLHFFR